MTITIATVLHDFAIVSSDTFVTPLDKEDVFSDAGISANTGEAAVSHLVGDGLPPSCQPLGFVQKLFPLPGMPAVAAGLGCWSSFQAFCAAIRHHHANDDLLSIETALPFRLRTIRRLIGSPLEIILQIYGYSCLGGRCLGLIFSSQDHFQPLRIEPGLGHQIHPMPTPDLAGYDALCAMWEPAARGIATEAFHVKLAKLQHETHRRGLYRRGSGIGGHLQTARITKDGINLAVAHEFPEFRAQIDALQPGQC